MKEPSMRGRRVRRAALDAQKSALTLWRFGSPVLSENSIRPGFAS
jgi:hypothetical protein